MKKSKLAKKKLKLVKRQLIFSRYWLKYCSNYKHKQMRLLASKIALIYNLDIDTHNLIKLEKMMLEASKNKEIEMFTKPFTYLQKLVKIEANWIDFAYFIFFVYQTSTFYSDLRWKKSNIFTSQNSVEQNAQKRKYFYRWLHSLDVSDPQFNIKIRKVLRVVF